MHSWYAQESQPYPTSNYSIFVAEVASTVNQVLFFKHLVAGAASDEERLALLGNFLEGLRTTVFRQTMFAEFELEIHERAERGEVLTGPVLNDIYLGLLRDYHGHEQGVMEIADTYAVEWAAVPHFYYDFYVYQYATGIIAAGALARRVVDGEVDARDRYLRFLATGGSDYPLALLRGAGVDLEESVAYREAFAAVGGYLDRLEGLLDAGARDGANLYMSPALHWLRDFGVKDIITTCSTNGQTDDLPGRPRHYLPTLGMDDTVYVAGGPGAVAEVESKARAAGVRCYTDPFLQSGQSPSLFNRLSSVVRLNGWASPARATP